MKVIFLDIDGVLNVIPTDIDKFGCTFHDNFVDNLRWIIEETGAKIVISSTWRMGGLKYIRDMWEFRNYPGEIIDITPTCKEVVHMGIREFYDLVDRGDEIKLWLDHYDVDNYVIIDDDNDMLPEQLNNFVRTSNNSHHPDCIDIGYGLTKICAEKAIKILNEKI
ncbi:MAG: HAD domain-containing protein [bacterium]